VAQKSAQAVARAAPAQTQFRTDKDIGKGMFGIRKEVPARHHKL
jgi:hypothetical protein